MNGRTPRSPAARPARATIDDVARAADVSKATVSRALSGAAYVRSETRERVVAAAEALDFRPSPTAQSLTTGRSMMIGIVVSDLEIPFFTTVARGIQNAAQGHGYLTLVGNSDERERTEDELVDAFMARMVDGLIITPSATPNSRLREVAGVIPLVLVDRLVPGLDADAVLSDNHAGARAATEHLLALGHRRIAYVTDEPDKTSTAERLAGFRAAMAEGGGDGDRVWVVDYHALAAEAAIRERLEAERPTALLASEGSITLGALRAIHDLGWRVPEDISLIGFDQLDWGTATTPPITVVSQDAEEIGARAAALLLRRLRKGRRSGTSAAPAVERVPTELVLRASTAAPRAD